MRFLTIPLIFLLWVLYAPMAMAEMVDLPQVKIQALDKSTARTTTLTAKVGSTITYGSLFIKVQACRQSAPLEKPENAAFLQVWEVPIGKKKSEWAFSGWMFSSSPALSAMDHAVYDVWVLECFSGQPEEEKPAAADQEEVAQDDNAQSIEDSEADESQDEAAETVAPEVEEKPTTRVQAESFDNVINDLAE